jgi:hypothetical protein
MDLRSFLDEIKICHWLKTTGCTWKHNIEYIMNKRNLIDPTPLIPPANVVQKLMRKLSAELFRAWRKEIGQRLRDLELEGEITKDDIDVSDAVWRLPNTEVRKALSKLQDLLEEAGYEYEFRFQDIDNINWILFYSIELPEREDTDDEDEDEEEEEDDQQQLDNVEDPCGNQLDAHEPDARDLQNPQDLDDDWEE